MSPAEWWQLVYEQWFGGNAFLMAIIGIEIFFAVLPFVIISWVWAAIPGPWWYVAIAGVVVLGVSTLVETVRARKPQQQERAEESATTP